jgi:hypothetical protein
MTLESDQILTSLPLGLRTRLVLEAAETGLTPAEIVAEALARHFVPAPSRRRRQS